MSASAEILGDAGLPMPAQADEVKTGSLLREAMRRVFRNPSALVGMVLISLFVFMALFAPLLAPYDPRDCNVSLLPGPGKVPGPSAEHWLGLDLNGCDELSRLMYGARYSLLIGIVSTAVGAFFGLLLGVLAGGTGRKTDNVIMRIVDIMLSVPGLLFAIAIAAILGRSLTSVMIAIAVVNIPLFARLLRGSMLSQRGADYVLATTSLGVKKRKVVLGHVLPNSIGPVIVAATLALATAIIDAAGLSFLGLGSNDPTIPEWGAMLAKTQEALTVAPQLAILPGLFIVFSVLGFNLLGEAMREALDPKLRR